MKKRIILIRHGATGSNGSGKYAGCRTDDPLCPETVEYISKMEPLPFGPVGKVYSSPLRRAYDTARLLFEGHDIEMVEGFREMDFGIFEGKTYDDLKDDRAYLDWISSGGKMKPPGGESMEDFTKRVMTGFYRVVKEADDKGCFPVMCHGGTIMAIMSVLTRRSPYDFQVKNLEGYDLTIETENERISDLTYDRIGPGDRT